MEDGGGLALALAAGGGALGLLLVSAPFLLVPASTRLGRIPWMATPPEATRRAIARAAELLAANRPSRPRLVDLGSGDGRLVIAAARLGFDAVGVELNPVLLLSSYIYAARAGVLGRVSFLACDLWGLDLAPFDVVTCFGVASSMPRLGAKLDREGRPGTLVVCFRFPIPGREPALREEELFFYRLAVTSQSRDR